MWNSILQGGGGGGLKMCAISRYPRSDVVRSNARSPSVMSDWGNGEGTMWSVSTQQCSQERVPLSSARTLILKPTMSDPAFPSVSLLHFETRRLSTFCLTSARYYLRKTNIYKHSSGREWTLKSVNAQGYDSGWLIFPRILCFCDFYFYFISSQLTVAVIWRYKTIERKAEVWQPDERNNGLFQDNNSKEEISKEYDHRNVRLYLCHTHLFGTKVP